MHVSFTENMIENYERDGVLVIRGMFADCVEPLREGVAFNLQHPGPCAAENLTYTESGRFFDD